MRASEEIFTQFHPLVSEWFVQHVGTPTDVQAAAWPKIAAGENVLITAPTGSGKTLTAFLWALNQLITGAFPAGHCRVLYVSPLKALNNDIQRNLLQPLRELHTLFDERGERFPNIRVQTRSGDTPQNARRSMLRKPPEILITTPESLNLLLSSQSGINMLSTLQVVILDEIHAVIDDKRGAHLMTAVERLVRLCGEFQRIALSATVRPMELVAAYVGGYRRLDGEQFVARPVTLVRSASQKAYRVAVRFPEKESGEDGGQSIWAPLVRECKEIIRRNRSTLIFTNARRLAETITWKINADEPELLAYAHHGSLAREIRGEVERRLKSGQLPAIVATNSLEMGIDIGALDEVILIQSPPGVASAIQRVGRAGHQVGEVSRATLFPTHGQDLIQAAVLARGIMRQQIEPAKVVRCPLDVLAQVIVSMVGVATWNIDELFADLRCSYTFHTLSRVQFDLVLDMLAGKYAETRLRELNPRISIDRMENTVAARPGALLTLYMSGGTIPNRGAYQLRLRESGAHIGELDEEYVWEARPGQTLTFGTQNWQIERITHNDVFVVPATRQGRAVPFWKSEGVDRSGHFSALIGEFLEEAQARLPESEYPRYLQEEHCLSADAARQLIGYLKRQQASTGCDLPHRHHIVAEHVAAGPDGHTGNQLILHTCWGGAVNRPFALALAAAWDERFAEQLEIYPADDAIYLLMTGDIAARDVLSLVTSARLEELLRKKLEGSAFFGARFRECAGRALLLTRRSVRERMPLWVTRLRAKNLLDAVQRFGDFPMVLEAWRTCLQDEFELDLLRDLLAECESGAITWSEVRLDTPSPFAQTMSRRQIEKYMYEDDTPTGRTASQLKPDLLREVVFTPELRPTLASDVVTRYLEKRRRLAPGYAPQSSRDLLDWVKERLLIPLPEWDMLLAAIQRDHGIPAETLLSENAGKLLRIRPDSHTVLIAATEELPRLYSCWEGEVSVAALSGELPALASRIDDEETREEQFTALLGEWLRYAGPVTVAELANSLGLSPERLLPVIEDLLETQTIISGQLTGDADEQLCDSDNYESLLRMARSAATPEIALRPCEEFPLFLAQYQGLSKPGERLEELKQRLAQLSGFPARVELWEEAFLPARLQPYDPSWLDTLLQEGEWHWVGTGKEQVSLCLQEDLPLLRQASPAEDALRDLLPDDQARYPLHSLAMRSGVGMGELVKRLWQGVWHGIISNDSFAALRKGITIGFQAPKLPEVDAQHTRGRRLPRGGYNRWANATPFAGNWYRLPEQESTNDLLDQEERAKDRARLLLDRYGVLFRELLQWETPDCQWPSVFRALRLMELSGEVFAGHFFTGISGLQFCSHRALRTLQHGLPEQLICWLNACDPASCCGLPLPPLKGHLPRRLPGNYLVYHGSALVLTLLRNGQELIFHVTPDDPHLSEYLAPLQHLLTRRFRPLIRVTIDKINGSNPCESPYLPALSASFDIVPDSNRLFIAEKRG